MDLNIKGFKSRDGSIHKYDYNALANIPKDENPDSDGDTIIPHIGENGNWYIGDDDTGVRAAGADGENGGYYSPEITPNEADNSFTITFKASKEGMPAVAPATIKLPEVSNDSGENGNDGATVPDYVITEAETMTRIINQHQSGDSVVFPVYTDAHCGYYADPDNAAVTLAGQLANEIGKRVPFDFEANLGDFSSGAWNSNRESTMKDIEDYTALLGSRIAGSPKVWVPGNHDDAPYQATADRLTQTETFAMIGRKSRVSGACCPAGCNYGYLDMENRNLRIIYLDTDDKRSWGTVAVGSGESAPAYLNAHNVGAEQLRWLIDTALDFSDKTDPTKWSIVVLSHVPLNVTGTITDAVSGETHDHNTVNAATILNAYATGASGSIVHVDTISYDFSTLHSRATITCCVHGHNHKFTSSMVGGIVSIGCPNVMNGRERESDDGNTYTKTAGTADGTSFCVLTIDRENLKIYADCVGAGYDREFEYTAEVVSYTNQIPISTDTDGNIYNGVGYKADTYLSSGNDATKTGIFASGFIPIVPNQYGNGIFYCKNVGMQTGQDSHRLVIYNADKTVKSQNKTSGSGYPPFKYGDDGNICEISIASTNFEVGGFIRICCGYIGKDSIITANEPIS